MNDFCMEDEELNEREYDDALYDWEQKMSYQRAKLQIGSKRVVYSTRDVSLNAIRDGRSDLERFTFTENDEPIGGNMNPNIERYHGWRGTTNDNSLSAYGLRRVIKIRKLKSGDVAITFGRDLVSDLE